MISVCIPSFNYDIRDLIRCLHNEIVSNQLDAEIIIIDDGSDNYWRELNHPIKNLSSVTYYEQNNLGRSKTRNNLAIKANGEYLVFVDCDCLVSDTFIFNYLRYIYHSVVIGGLTYGPIPKNKDLKLRWKYGIKRESKVECSENGNSFLSSNFMISKKLFNSIQFDSSINGYGHEDTILGIEIRMRGYEIIQINNPVKHLGLDKTEVFLNKTEEAIFNLQQLMKNSKFKTYLAKNGIGKLLNWNTPPWINRIVSFLFQKGKYPILQILKNIYPSLLLFDIYKILYVFNLKARLEIRKSSN